jgi:hypothetical protein
VTNEELTFWKACYLASLQGSTVFGVLPETARDRALVDAKLGLEALRSVVPELPEGVVEPIGKRILMALALAGESMWIPQIAAATSLNANQVRSHLSNMRASGYVELVKRGVYIITEAGRART